MCVCGWGEPPVTSLLDQRRPVIRFFTAAASDQHGSVDRAGAPAGERE